MTEIKKGNLLVEGKTKNIFEVLGDERCIIAENKPDITRDNDPDLTRQFAKKAEYATNTTCRIFELLRQAGIPVAYMRQLSLTEFLAEKCEMIPLEVVARRYAVGSYLKRYPHLKQPERAPPLRFNNLVVEFFLKTTNGKLVGKDGKVLVDGLTKAEEDPFIAYPDSDDIEWRLFHPKKPSWEEGADLERTIDPFEDVLGNEEFIDGVEDILRDVFLVIEGAFGNLGYRFIDLKIEFGVNSEDELVIADVIDNDSWRLKTFDWEELSKEAFRQGEELDEVEKKYGFVSYFVNQFRIPKQVIVFWRGSEKDDFPKIGKEFKKARIEIEEVTLSGHKSSIKCSRKLNELAAKYPEGGVIITKVGMSNGLGPTLAARTSWPVIAVPASVKGFPEDVWSSLRMPSNVPMMTVLSEKNALLTALNIFAQKNPLAYWQRQKVIEELDESLY